MALTCFSFTSYVLTVWMASAPGMFGNAADKPAKQVFSPVDRYPVVLYFIASDCPISNRSLPEMLRIEREFASQHVHFWFIYPNVTETSAGILNHSRSYGLGSNIGRDSDGRLAKLTGAKATPEAAVLVRDASSMRPVYVGRIDDRNVTFGVQRPAALHHELEEAVLNVLNGRRVEGPKGPSVGCYFVTAR